MQKSTLLFCIIECIGSLIVHSSVKLFSRSESSPECNLWEGSWVTIQVPIALGYFELCTYKHVNRNVVAQDEVNFNKGNNNTIYS